QARDSADVLPVRLRAWWQPDRAVQPLRAADLRARLASHQLVRSRARQGPGLGPGHDPVLPHPRHSPGSVSDSSDGAVPGAAATGGRPVIAVLGLGEAGSAIA